MENNGQQKENPQQIDTNNCVENGSPNERNNSNEEEPIEDQPEREITQTDHLNKRLLDSFLQRINESTARVPVVERISTSDTEEDFESDTTQISDNKIQ